MSDRLTERIAADLEAERVRPVRLTMTPDEHLKASGFRPTRLARNRTDYAPVAQPDRPNGYLAPAPPGVVVATLDESGMVTLPPGTISERWPDIAARIKLAADSVRLAGVPVVVLLIDATPSKDKAHAAE